jgi:LysR family transcriptional regulator, regulator for metE and metH
MLLETRHLLLVHEIAEQGGVTRASKRLFLTQSAVSHQLLDLERRLGTRLFHRAGKRMVPTVAGQRVLEAAQSALGRLQQLEDDLRRIALGQEAVLRLSTQCYTCYHWLPAILSEYQRRFPHVDVQIIAEATQQPLVALLDGRIDLGIVHEDSDDERLSYSKLFRDELLLVMSAEHRLARKRHVDAEDLRAEHLILYGVPLPEMLFYREVLVPAGVQPRKISHIQLTEAIVELVRANVGVTVLARWAAAPYLSDGRLASVRISARGLPRQWYAATIKQTPVPLHLREFIQMIRLGPSASEEVRTA